MIIWFYNKHFGYFGILWPRCSLFIANLDPTNVCSHSEYLKYLGILGPQGLFLLPFWDVRIYVFILSI